MHAVTWRYFISGFAIGFLYKYILYSNTISFLYIYLFEISVSVYKYMHLSHYLHKLSMTTWEYPQTYNQTLIVDGQS